MTPDKLPHRVELQISREADDYRFACPNVAPHIAYNAGATAWAPWKVQHDELKKVLQEFVRKHEAGLLPNRFVYEKAIKALKGEVETSKNKTMENKEPTASYTKGQWYLQKYTDAYTNIVRCNNGKHETIFIASTPQSSLPESRANAQLMSAAPDLLEALQEVIAISDRKHDAWDKAKAAIEKALGPWKDGKGKEVGDEG